MITDGVAEYVTVFSSHGQLDFDIKVNAKLQEGWLLFGEPCSIIYDIKDSSSYGAMYHYQRMVKLDITKSELHSTNRPIKV
jgi:hypothetical protein